MSNSVAKSLEHALSFGAPIEDLQDFNAEAQGALSRLAESDFKIMTHGDPLEVLASTLSPDYCCYTNTIACRRVCVDF